MMRFVDQIHEAFRETVRAGSLVGVGFTQPAEIVASASRNSGSHVVPAAPRLH